MKSEASTLLPFDSTESVTVTRKVCQSKIVERNKRKSYSPNFITPRPLTSTKSDAVTIQKRHQSQICLRKNQAEERKNESPEPLQKRTTKFLTEELRDSPNIKANDHMVIKKRPASKLFLTQKIKKPRKKLNKKKLKTEGSGPFFCDLCPEKIFISLEKVKSHLLVVHLGLQSCVCTVCGKCLKSIGSLNRHKILHTGEKPFACKTCGKTFSLKESLSLHERAVHEKEKRFCCYICGYQFFALGRFKTHLRRHNQEKTHFCHLCPKAFYTKYHLNGHVLTHDRRAKPRGPNRTTQLSK